MRAAVYYDKDDIRIEDVPRPVCKDDEVLIKAAYSQWCCPAASRLHGTPPGFADQCPSFARLSRRRNLRYVTSRSTK